MRTLILAAAGLALATAPATAQKQEKAPRRPELPAGADTNDAQAYYQYGLMRLVKGPSEAADAFYWAIRLSPTWAEPYYARRSALLLERKPMLWSYITGRRGVVNSKQVRAIDSLAREAYLRNPFLPNRFDRLMLEEAIHYESEGTVYLNRMRSGDPAWDAWMAYGDGDYRKAADLYGQALRKRPKEFARRLPRARAFYHLLELDSAANELTLLLAEMRKNDDESLVYFYESKEILEYSLGHIYYLMDRLDDARAAYGRALEEDLSFYMAHVDLAQIALKQGDTTTALSELALGVELGGSDVGVRIRYADALVVAGRIDEALPHYRAAIEQEPFYAHSYFQLARALDAQGKASEAVEQYRAYIPRAPRSRTEIAEAEKRIAALAASGGSSP